MRFTCCLRWSSEMEHEDIASEYRYKENKQQNGVVLRLVFSCCHLVLIYLLETSRMSD